jgi:hypothetical protein
MNATALRKLTLISRRYCHLCDDMQSALENLQGGLAFGLEVIDLDAHPAMEGRYGELVPVLLDGDAEICHYFLDREKLAAHLASV